MEGGREGGRRAGERERRRGREGGMEGREGRGKWKRRAKGRKRCTQASP